MTKADKFSPKQRRQSRRALLQALYQWDLAKTGAADLQQFMVDEGSLDRADKKYFTQCLQGIMRGVHDLDRTYAPYLDRSFDDITPVERACLRGGSFELLEREDVPTLVVINEWVELAKLFGAQDSYRYINAVLDAVARTTRPPHE
ncbi:MAG: transcription antitermination factor NusB [Gammaproteobacteria bacterium]|nr:transcription antitermination factor NusB [Gammaproteobacteria bacterium]MYF38841.1 transcription antitermination factor NusB [Gammaproteobacteria bacterium]